MGTSPFFVIVGQISGYIGAAALLDELHEAQWPIADRAMMPIGSGAR